MDSSADMAEMGEVLLDIDGTLVLPQNGPSGENEFSMEKSFMREGQVAIGEQFSNLFHTDEQTKEVKADILEALLPPLSKEEGLILTPLSTSNKRPLSNPQPYDAPKRFKPCRPMASSAGSQVTPEPILQPASITAMPARAPRKLEPGPVLVCAASDVPGAEVVPKPKHVCSKCGNIFKRAHNLKIHGRKHSGATPYACPNSGCDKKFRWKSSIVSHMNWHRKRGDTLPGEPGDTSIPNAALRQGAMRREPVGEKKRGTKEKTKAKEEQVIGQVQAGSERAEEEAGKGSNVGSTAGEAAAAELDMNALLVEMGGLVSGCEYRGVAAGAGAEKDGAVLTPSTTTESYCGSGPGVELEDLENLSVFAERTSEEKVGGEVGVGLAGLGSGRMEEAVGLLDVFLDQEGEMM